MSKKISLLVLMALVLLLFAIPASAEDSSTTVCTINTWSGDVSTVWSVGGNWSCGVKPDDTHTAIIPTTPTGAQFPIADENIHVENLEVQAGASFDLNGKTLQVDSALTNDGTLIDRRTISSFVIFPTCFFCQGGYAGLLLSRNTGGILTDPGVVEVKIKGNQGTCDSGNSTIGRCFDISPANTTNVSINALFPFTDTERNGLMCTSLQAYHWNGSGWSLAGQYLFSDCTGSDLSVTMTGITSFSPFVLGAATPTAVSLVGFDTQAPMLPLILGAAAFGLLAIFAGGILLSRKQPKG